MQLRLADFMLWETRGPPQNRHNFQDMTITDDVFPMQVQHWVLGKSAHAGADRLPDPSLPSCTKLATGSGALASSETGHAWGTRPAGTW